MMTSWLGSVLSGRTSDASTNYGGSCVVCGNSLASHRDAQNRHVSCGQTPQAVGVPTVSPALADESSGARLDTHTEGLLTAEQGRGSE